MTAIFFFLAGLALWIISAVFFFLAIVVCVKRNDEGGA